MPRFVPTSFRLLAFCGCCCLGALALEPPSAESDLLCRADDGCRGDAGLGLLQLSRQPQASAPRAEESQRESPRSEEPFPVLARLFQTGYVEKPTDEHCKMYPVLCAEPFNCFSDPLGPADIMKFSVGKVATDDGHANVKSWCMNPAWDQLIPKHCIASPDLKKNAHVVFEKQVRDGVGELDGSYCFLEGHCVNTAVTPETTLAEAEGLCDEKYGHDEWASISLLKVPVDFTPSKASGFKSRKWTSYFGKLACAMGNYHCDVIYCRETYCKMPEYRSKYEHFLKENGWA